MRAVLGRICLAGLFTVMAAYVVFHVSHSEMTGMQRMLQLWPLDVVAVVLLVGAFVGFPNRHS
jgi:hypothetical protein